MENKKFTSIQEIDQLFENIPLEYDEKSFREWGLKRINRSDIKKYFHIRLSSYNWKQHSIRKEENKKKETYIPKIAYVKKGSIAKKKSPLKERNIKQKNKQVNTDAKIKFVPIVSFTFGDKYILYQSYRCNNKSSKKSFNSIKRHIQKHVHIVLNRSNKSFDFLYDDEIKELLPELNQYNRYYNSSYNTPRQLNSTFTPHDHVTRIIPWKHIVFGDKKIIIYACDKEENRIFTVKALVLDNNKVKKTFNYVKTYFEKRLPPIEVVMDKKQIIKILNPIKIDNAILHISNREKHLSVNEMQQKKQNNNEKKYSNFTVAYNAGESISLLELKKYKSQYLNFLATNQQKNRRLVPSVEVKSYDNQYKEEDAFIFSIRTKFDNLIIYENINPKHSTIIFSIEPDLYMDALKDIYNYFDSGILNKRSKIRSRTIKFSKKRIKYYYTVNHGSFFEWKWKIFHEIKE